MEARLQESREANRQEQELRIKVEQGMQNLRKNHEQEAAQQVKIISELKSNNSNLMKQLERSQSEMKGTFRKSKHSNMDMVISAVKISELEEELKRARGEIIHIQNEREHAESMLVALKAQVSALNSRKKKSDSSMQYTGELGNINHKQSTSKLKGSVVQEKTGANLEEPADADSNTALLEFKVDSLNQTVQQLLQKNEALQAEMIEMHNRSSIASESEEVDHLHKRLKEEVFAKEKAIFKMETALKEKKLAEMELNKLKDRLGREMETKSSLEICVSALEETINQEVAKRSSLENKLLSQSFDGRSIMSEESLVLTDQNLNAKTWGTSSAKKNTEALLIEKDEQINEISDAFLALEEKYEEMMRLVQSESESKAVFEEMIEGLRLARDEADARADLMGEREAALNKKIQDMQKAMDKQVKEYKNQLDLDYQRLQDADKRELDLMEQYEQVRRTVDEITGDFRKIKEILAQKEAEIRLLKSGERLSNPVLANSRPATVNRTMRNLDRLEPPSLGTTETRNTMNKRDKERFKELQHLLEISERKVKQLEKENAELMEETHQQTKTSFATVERVAPTPTPTAPVTTTTNPMVSRRSSDTTKLFSPLNRFFNSFTTSASGTFIAADCVKWFHIRMS